jgi:hypothetical protein
VAPFPFIVWGADELRRWAIRRRHPQSAPAPDRRSTARVGAGAHPPSPPQDRARADAAHHQSSESPAARG